MNADEIYSEIILDYYRHPKNFGKLKKPDATSNDSNPLCGDKIEMQLKIDKGKVTDVKFNGSGCAISQAAASMLTEMIKGKKLDDIVKMDKDDVLKLLGVELSPIRLKCALLPLKVLKLSVYSYLGKK